jgi:hypothetical protein
MQDDPEIEIGGDLSDRIIRKVKNYDNKMDFTAKEAQPYYDEISKKILIDDDEDEGEESRNHIDDSGQMSPESEANKSSDLLTDILRRAGITR